MIPLRQAEADGHAAADIPRHDVRMDGVRFERAHVTAPFIRALPPGNFSYCVMVRAGRLRLETDFPVRLREDLADGDVVAVSGLTPHLFRSAAETIGEGGPSGSIKPFETRPMTERQADGDVDLIVGIAPNEGLALGSLMVGPILVRRAERPDLARRLWSAAEMIEDEYADASWIDRNLVIRRLAEIMLINISRQIFAERGAGAADGSGVAANRNLMRAISAFFATPEKAWSLGEMARAAGMSRTRFAQEFKVVTGATPARIISRMRLTAVARRLTVDEVSVERAADQAGYSSSSAFVRAFQREFGETPARWRRRREGSETAGEPLATSGVRARGARRNRVQDRGKGA